MLEIRLLHEEEFREAVNLSDQVFRDKEHISMGKAFPHVFSNHLLQSYGAFIDQKLVAFTGLVPTLVHIGSAQLKVYSLGSVATHPEHRKKGYASEILKRILDHINKSEASLLLVSGDRDLYKRVNCFPFGTIHEYKLTPPSLSEHDFNIENIREFEPTDWFQMKELADHREVRFEQSIWDLAMLIKVEPFASIYKMKHKVLVSTKDGKIDAFLVIAMAYKSENRSESIVIEWAGDERALTGLMYYAVKKFNVMNIKLSVPWHEKKLIYELNSLEYTVKLMPGTIHIVNSERLFQQISPYLEEKDQKRFQLLKVTALEDGQTQISANGESILFNPLELVQLIFGGHLNSNNIGGELKVILNELFPIPFPYTAGLNYV